MSRLLLTCILAVVALPAIAASDCAVPIQYSAYDVSVKSVLQAADDRRYENECKSNASAAGLNVGAGFDGVDLKVGSSSQSKEDFCRTYKSDSGAKSSNYQYAQTAVRDAYSAFIACKQLESRNVRANFTIMPRMLVVDISRMAFQAEFRGISAAPAGALQCTRSDPNGGAALAVGPSEKIPVSDGEYLVVTCTRKNESADGGEAFHAVDVAINTNLGPATVNLAAAKYPEPITTDALNAKIAALESKLELLEGRSEQRFGKINDFNTKLYSMFGASVEAKWTPEEKGKSIRVNCGKSGLLTGFQLKGNQISSSGFSMMPHYISGASKCVTPPEWPVATQIMFPVPAKAPEPGK